MPILKHRLEPEGISHVVSLVSFHDVKAENNFTNKIVAHQTTIEPPKNSSLVILLFIHIFRYRNYNHTRHRLIVDCVSEYNIDYLYKSESSIRF